VRIKNEAIFRRNLPRSKRLCFPFSSFFAKAKKQNGGGCVFSFENEGEKIFEKDSFRVRRSLRKETEKTRKKRKKEKTQSCCARHRSMSDPADGYDDGAGPPQVAPDTSGDWVQDTSADSAAPAAAAPQPAAQMGEIAEYNGQPPQQQDQLSVWPHYYMPSNEAPPGAPGDQHNHFGASQGGATQPPQQQNFLGATAKSNNANGGPAPAASHPLLEPLPVPQMDMNQQQQNTEQQLQPGWPQGVHPSPDLGAPSQQPQMSSFSEQEALGGAVPQYAAVQQTGGQGTVGDVSQYGQGLTADIPQYANGVPMQAQGDGQQLSGAGQQMQQQQQQQSFQQQQQQQQQQPVGPVSDQPPVPASGQFLQEPVADQPPMASGQFWGAPAGPLNGSESAVPGTETGVPSDPWGQNANAWGAQQMAMKQQMAYPQQYYSAGGQVGMAAQGGYAAPQQYYSAGGQVVGNQLVGGGMGSYASPGAMYLPTNPYMSMNPYGYQYPGGQPHMMVNQSRYGAPFPAWSATQPSTVDTKSGKRHGPGSAGARPTTTGAEKGSRSNSSDTENDSDLESRRKRHKSKKRKHAEKRRADEKARRKKERRKRKKQKKEEQARATEYKIPPDKLRDACQYCGTAERAHCMLVCDGCDTEWHMSCLPKVIFHVPPGLWFCPRCVVDGTQEKMKDGDEAKVRAAQDIAESNRQPAMSQYVRAEEIFDAIAANEQTESESDDDAAAALAAAETLKSARATALKRQKPKPKPKLTAKPKPKAKANAKPAAKRARGRPKKAAERNARTVKSAVAVEAPRATETVVSPDESSTSDESSAEGSVLTEGSVSAEGSAVSPENSVAVEKNAVAVETHPVAVEKTSVAVETKSVAVEEPATPAVEQTADADGADASSESSESEEDDEESSSSDASGPQRMVRSSSRGGGGTRQDMINALPGEVYTAMNALGRARIPAISKWVIVNSVISAEVQKHTRSREQLDNLVRKIIEKDTKTFALDGDDIWRAVARKSKGRKL
jgi:hypothetical protein